MKLIDKEIIREEIERRYKECHGATPASEYQELLSFIDSMQEEPVSEDLETAAEERVDAEDYCCVDEDGMPLYDGTYLEYMFKEGANWQKQQIIGKMTNLEKLNDMVDKFEAKYKPQKNT